MHHAGVDGVPQAPPVPRKLTAPGGFAALPGHELTKTVRAPSTTAPTMRATPPAGIPLVRPEVPAVGQPDATEELAAARLRIAQLERDARARAETQVDTFPPKVEARSQRNPSPVPSSSPEAKLDKAIGSTVRLAFERYGWKLLAVCGIGAAVLKPAGDPAKQEATLANTEAIKRELELTRKQLDGLLDREAARDVYLTCLAEQQSEYFAQLSPAADKMGAAAPLRPFVDRCKSRKP